jgi:hypothetical protein
MDSGDPMMLDTGKLLTIIKLKKAPLIIDRWTSSWGFYRSVWCSKRDGCCHWRFSPVPTAGDQDRLNFNGLPIFDSIIGHAIGTVKAYAETPRRVPVGNEVWTLFQAIFPHSWIRHGIERKVFGFLLECFSISSPGTFERIMCSVWSY